MIQSGKDIFLDNNTKLTICSFTPWSLESGAYFDVSTAKLEFIQRSASIVQIRNIEDQTCFARCLVLGLAHSGDGLM